MSTIAAISTPRGVGGIAVIRVSGDDAAAVCGRIFLPKSGKAMDSYPAGTEVHGTFRDGSGDFDDGMAVLFRAPRSFTGEDTAEFSCHGGLLVQQRLLAACFAAGCVPAMPGEFSKRAFINGKLTLSQAEAIGGIIDARTDECLYAGLRQLGGSLSEEINGISHELVSAAAAICACADYPDEDITETTSEELKERLGRVLDRLEALIKTHRYGKAISDGIRTVICGRPNTGKSTLMNRLCGEDRVIVSDSAGTTRDVVTETVRVGSVLLRLSDTAGIRDGAEGAEKSGIERSKSMIESAELILCVFDGSRDLTDDDRELIRATEPYRANTVCVMNKCDLGRCASPFEPAVYVSAKSGDNMAQLYELINSFAGKNDAGNGEIIVSARQHAAAVRCAEAVRDALTTLDGFTPDVAATDIARAAAAIGEIDGRTVGEEIVGEIFSHFCVGK